MSSIPISARQAAEVYRVSEDRGTGFPRLILVIDTFMDIAIEEALVGLSEGGIPIGSVLVVESQIVGRGHNRRVQEGSAILHGEMDALERAGRMTGSDYRRSILYTTLSPCHMCTGAIILYGIPKVIIGENRTFLGAEYLLHANDVEVVVLDDERCVQMMSEFISEAPELWNEDIGV
jgi:cytosine/creatinine deaminase